MKLRQLNGLNKTNLSDIEKIGNPEAITTQLLDVNNIQKDKRVIYPRASGIYRDCMRAYALGNLKKLKAKEFISFSRQLTFDIGNAIHEWLQNSPDYFGDQRRGYWKCLSCNYVTYFSKPRVTPCPKCGANPTAFKYEEALLILREPYNISGHPDLFIEPEHAPGSMRIVEFKTMDGDKFASLKAPLVEHMWQVNAYMWMCQEDPILIPTNIDSQLAYIVYISKKEKQGMLPMKTFLVKRNLEIITEIKEKLAVFNQAIKAKQPPEPLLECIKTGFNGWSSRYCPVKEHCKKDLQTTAK